MRTAAASPRRALRVYALVAVAAVLLGLPAVGGSSAVAATRAGPVPFFGSSIEAFAPYQGQTICSPTPKPGVLALQAWLSARYPGTGSSGISRGCSVGGRSEHKEGRAFDWRVSASDGHERTQAQAFIALVLATDSHGNHAALARRMGLMYLIWDDRIYSSGQEFSPRPYVHAACTAAALGACGDTLRHRDHVHISMDWAGALGRTSFWDGTVSGTVAPPSGPSVAPPLLTLPTTPRPVPPQLPRPQPVPRPTPPPVAAPRPAPKPRPVVTPQPKPVVKPQPQPAVKPQPTPAGRPVPAAPTGPAPPSSAVPSGPPVLDQRRNPVTLLAVPVSGPGLTTAFSLAAGRTYRLVATGGYAVGPGPRLADAACAWQLTGDAGWAAPSGGSTRQQLQVSGAVGWRSRDGAGCDADEHVYVWDYTPTLTAPLHLQVDDPAPGSTGVLQLRVLVAGASARPFTTAVPELVPEPVAPPLTSGEPLSGTEVITVDAGTGGRTDSALQAGRSYTVEVAGTWSAGEGVEADAQCSRTSSGTWRPQRSADPWHPWLDSYDLYADGVQLQGADGVQAQAECDTGHVYRHRYVPRRTGRVAFAVWDPTPGDDTGSMQVTVWPRRG